MVKNVLKKSDKRKMNNKGFSLVELIVVIAIMAVLVGVLAPQLIKYVEKSRQSTDIQTCDNIATALKTYYADEESTVTATVEISKSGVANQSEAALTSAGLTEAKLKGSWTGDTITIKYENGTVTYTGSSDYYTANGTGEFTKK